MRPLCVLLPLLAGALLSVVASDDTDQLTVNTGTGIYTGLVDKNFPHVRQFRSIPYAQPPLGKRRWLPPVAVTPSARRSFAYRFPPSCPQYQSKNLTVWTTNITDFAIRLYGQSFTAGAMAQASSEDCLYLAIWTPVLDNATDSGADDRKLPVALFLPGGDFVGGGVDVPYQQPTPWVERTRKHIVVTANYRLNIGGFPWAAGLETQNVGLLDARMALEWVYANIAAFGGDPSRIMLWGQSAGGVAVDMVAHANPEEPLAASLFMQSGTAMVNISRPDAAHSNFSFVARNLGCDFASDPAAELECMRQVPMPLLQNFIGQYKDNATRPLLTFKPAPDERVVFFNYTTRDIDGHLPAIPALVSTTSNEVATLSAYPLKNVTEGPYQPPIDAGTVGIFVCLASNTTVSRARKGLTTYRYEYAGNFSSVTPLAWMGAYHASDVPMIFGTYDTPTPGRVGFAGPSAVGDFERKVAETLQDYVLTFMEDPEHGLRNRGWPAHDDIFPGGGGGRNMLRIAAGAVVARNVSAGEIDDACVLGAKYNSSPS
ncbi:Alpha/Beta hydrolase protein [Lasiosphaeris hirsuta]|uniref:Carboxylic ester hydrolase n=1 Tax=Lasiosphaeris hirsuta TaxID=260670 RepID=A0AA40A2G8_9PEZI|nr:Alpha/Beta hydrolase protein [Lasiosphaeris hirsuta]